MTSIYLNIYDLTPLNKILDCFGFGAYHSAVQIFDTEFSFGAHPFNFTGVVECQANSNKLRFRKTILLGESKLKLCEINMILDEIKSKYIGNSYDVFKNNCNHFANEVSLKLLQKPIPRYINRLPYFSRIFRCFVSSKLIYGDALKNDSNNKKHFVTKKITINFESQNILDKESQMNFSKNDTHKSEIIVEQINESNQDLDCEKKRKKSLKT